MHVSLIRESVVVDHCNFTVAGVVIGFDQTLYQVNEDAGQAVVNVVVRMGTLRRPVVVNVFTADDTALGE